MLTMKFVPCGHSGAPIVGMNVARHEATRPQVAHTGRSLFLGKIAEENPKKKVCARRESDPGPKLGKLRCCHYTTSAGSVFKKSKIYKPISSMYRALVSNPCVRAVWNGLAAGLHHSCSFILLPAVVLCAYESFQIHLLHI